LYIFSSLNRALGATKGTVMDRYISTINGTMNSVSSVSRFERVVRVAMLRVRALLHVRALSWRWDAVGSEANPEAASGFSLA